MDREHKFVNPKAGLTNCALDRTIISDLSCCIFVIMRMVIGKLCRLAIIAITFIPFNTLAQRDIAGYYADESERWNFLDLRCDGRYVFTMSARCMGPAYIDSGRYKVCGDTVFISSAT